MAERTTRQKHTRERLAKAVAESSNIAQVLQHLGVAIRGGSLAYISKRIKHFKIPWPHYVGRRKSPANKVAPQSLLTVDPLNGRRVPGKRLTSAMVSLGVPYKCASQRCGITEEWLGKRITLQVDHINGDHTDNRLENLRFLCPNCHSQTPTFGRGGVRAAEFLDAPIRSLPSASNRTFKSHECPVCFLSFERVDNSKNRSKPVLYCSLGCSDVARTKISWPSDERLHEMVWEKSGVSLGKDLGVSSVAIAKRCRLRGIPTPPRGYWAKLRAGLIQPGVPSSG